MTADDEFDSVWDRSLGSDAEPSHPEPDESADEAAQEIEIGPPIRVTFVIRATSVPVAPWAQGWRLAAAGPIEGQMTLLFEHDIDASPVAQLAAVTGLLGTVKSARLDVVWWAIQTRGPFPFETDEGTATLEDELSDLLMGGGTPPPDDPDDG